MSDPYDAGNWRINDALAMADHVDAAHEGNPELAGLECHECVRLVRTARANVSARLVLEHEQRVQGLDITFAIQDEVTGASYARVPSPWEPAESLKSVPLDVPPVSQLFFWNPASIHGDHIEGEATGDWSMSAPPPKRTLWTRIKDWWRNL